MDVKSNGGVGGSGPYQCVDLVKRLYVAHGWAPSSWRTGNGDQVWQQNPGGLVAQAQGSISYLHPGDAVSMEVREPSGADEAGGHVAIVNSVSGDSVVLVQQNAASVYLVGATWNGSRISIPDSGSWSYPVLGVLHAGGRLPGGYEMAFQANTGSLYSDGTVGGANWQQGMMAGTSPSIAALSNGGYEMAFQANNGDLYTIGAAGGTNWQQGMMAGTSPSITALPNGGYEMAFQANNGDLYSDGTAGGLNWQQGMKSGTSPSIAALSNGGYEMAFQANTGSLYSDGTAGGLNWQQGMMAGTSPSIAP